MCGEFVPFETIGTPCSIIYFAQDVHENYIESLQSICK